MAVPNKRGSLFLVSLALAFCGVALPARADEIRLKSGRTLHGVIVGYEDDMFKVKTDDGFELVRKDKIESIIPSTPAGKTATTAPAKPEGGAPTPGTPSQPQTGPAGATGSDASTAAANAGTKTVSPGPAGKAGSSGPAARR